MSALILKLPDATALEGERLMQLVEPIADASGLGRWLRQLRITMGTIDGELNFVARKGYTRNKLIVVHNDVMIGAIYTIISGRGRERYRYKPNKGATVESTSLEALKRRIMAEVLL